MSEMPYAATNGGAGLYSIEEQEHFYAHLFNHENDLKITAITNMIDQAANDVSMGLNYLGHNYSEYKIEATEFLDDALHALNLSKHLS